MALSHGHTSRVPQAEIYVKKFDRMSGVLGDMGLSLIRLSKYDEEGGMELARFTHVTESVQAVR